MFAMLKQLFKAFEILFTAFEKGANAINHLAGWAEESAASFEDEARIERAQRATELTKANNTIKKLAA